MAQATNEEGLLKSPLEADSDFLRNIGLLTVEISNMELLFALLLTRLLDIELGASLAVFYTPQSSRARFETVRNVADQLLAADDVRLARLHKLCRRAEKTLTHRNALVHGLWVASEHGAAAVSGLATGTFEIRKPDSSKMADLIREIRKISFQLLDLNMTWIPRPQISYDPADYVRLPYGTNNWISRDGYGVAMRADQDLVSF